MSYRENDIALKPRVTGMRRHSVLQGYVGANKIIISSLGIHHLEIVMGDTLCVLIGSTESVCSPYDAFKK